MNDKSSVKFVGNSGLTFIDEDGVEYFVLIRTTSSENYDRILYSKDLKSKCRKELTDSDRENIISKILELNKEIKWQII
jgi:hypothetical protein